MKQFKIVSVTAITAFVILMLGSCNSGDQSKTAEKAADSTANLVMAPPVASSSNIVIIKHKVANFAKWRTAFEANDSTQQSFGLHNYVLARGTNDSNMIMVVAKFDDIARAKEFSQSADLKTKMKSAGVIGIPEISFQSIQMVDTTANLQIARVMMTHKVKDWDVWKKVFEEHKQTRIDAGLSDRAIGYSVDDNHMVTVVCSVNDKQKADAFMASKDLKDKMAAAGVEGPPSIFYYNVVQRYK